MTYRRVIEQLTEIISADVRRNVQRCNSKLQQSQTQQQQQQQQQQQIDIHS